MADVQLKISHPLVQTDHGLLISAYGEHWPLMDDFSLELACYRLNHRNLGWEHLMRAWQIAWPEDLVHGNHIWDIWTEQRIKAHCAGYKVITWAAGGGTKKALTNSSKIRTPAGWVAMGDISVGDTICDTEGGQQRVIEVSPQGAKECFRVTFSDGSVVDCTGDHLWHVRSNKDRDRGKDGKVKTTLEILDTIHREYTIPTHQAVAGIASAGGPPPYVVGYTFGNGHFCADKSCRITCPDEQIADRIAREWPCGIRAYYPEKSCYGFNLLKHDGYFQQFAGKRSHEKILPQELLYLPAAERVELLRGLMDSDGCAYQNKGRPARGGVYSSTSNVLALQVLELARSCGYVATITGPKITFFSDSNGEKKAGRESWLVNLVINPGQPVPFWVERKASKFDNTRVRITPRRIVEIVPLGPQPCQCISVSHPNGLFITDDYVVTHNSNDAAKLGILFYLSDPENRRVVCCSTTIDMADARVWGLVKREYLELKKRFPNLAMGDVKTKPPSVMHNYRDSINCMRAAALHQGDEDKTLANVIGVHPKGGYLLIVDEATDVASGFIGSFGNLEKSTAFFQCIAIGNSNKKTDPHGILSTPVSGWASVNPDIDESWETRYGICLYFDCYKSPAIYEKDPLRRQHLEKFLPTLKSIKRAAQEKGESSVEFWRMDRGFWPPDDLDRTVLNPSLVERKLARIMPEWTGNKLIQLAGCDPAYTSDGDDCIVRQATLGEDISGRQILDFGGVGNVSKIEITAGGGDAYYQVTEKLRNWCDRRGIDTNHTAVETGGINLGLSGILDKEWSPGVLKVSFNGSPTDRVIDSRGATAKESYYNRVTELWFSMRRFVDTAQIRGLDDDTLFQFYHRRYNADDRKIYKKIEIEAKPSYKGRMKKINPRYGSPDSADAAVIVLELAIARFNFTPEFAEIPHKRVLDKKLSEDEKMGLYYDPDRYRSLQRAALSNPLEMPAARKDRGKVSAKPFSTPAKSAWPARH